ncbi:hypothetical protein [Clostridium saccharoperbutylacetonicum]
MRNIKRKLAWFAIAFVVQQFMFLFIDKIYLASDSNFKVEKVEEQDNPADKKTEINIKSGIDEIKVSSDGRYVAYIEGGKLKVLDGSDDKEKQCDTDSGNEIVFYKWLNGENKVLVIQKVKEKGSYYLEPISFDAKKGETSDIANFDRNIVKIKLNNSKDEVNNVAFSNLTHSLYIEVKKSSEKCDLYYANIMSEMKKVKSDRNITDIVVPTTNANAVVEEGNNLSILNTKGNLLIPNVKTPKILGADVNDNVYFGEASGDKIEKIHYTVLSDKNRKWNEFKLPEPTEKEDIIVDYSGKVYVNNKAKKSLTELTTNKSLKYKGELVQSYSKGVISRENNKLYKNKLD